MAVAVRLLKRYFFLYTLIWTGLLLLGLMSPEVYLRCNFGQLSITFGRIKIVGVKLKTHLFPVLT